MTPSRSQHPPNQRVQANESPVSVVTGLAFDYGSAAAAAAEEACPRTLPAGRGRLELVIGPMFSGKTTKMLHRIRRHGFANRKVLLVKYCKDERYSVGKVATHDNVTGNDFDTLSVVRSLPACVFAVDVGAGVDVGVDVDVGDGGFGDRWSGW